MSDTKPYQESDKFVPEPTAQFGTLDTSGTAGVAHSRLEEITPVFDVARKQEAKAAAAALDPEDDSVPASLVILPDSDRTKDEAVETVKARAKAVEDDEVTLLTERKTLAQKQAEETGDEAGQKADGQTGSQGASGGLDGSGTGTTKAEPTSEASEAQDKSAKPQGTQAESSEAGDKGKTPAKKAASSNR